MALGSGSHTTFAVSQAICRGAFAACHGATATAAAPQAPRSLGQLCQGAEGILGTQGCCPSRDPARATSALLLRRVAHAYGAAFPPFLHASVHVRTREAR